MGATSGIGVMLFMLAAGFNAMFWFALSDTTGVWGGCNGPIGACGTISCIAGTYRVEMYVFMQVTLTLIPLLIVQQVGQTLLQSSDDVCSLQRWCARLVITCMVLVPLTGMFPAKYETDGVPAFLRSRCRRCCASRRHVWCRCQALRAKYGAQ